MELIAHRARHPGFEESSLEAMRALAAADIRSIELDLLPCADSELACVIRSPVPEAQTFEEASTLAQELSLLLYLDVKFPARWGAALDALVDLIARSGLIVTFLSYDARSLEKRIGDKFEVALIASTFDLAWPHSFVVPIDSLQRTALPSEDILRRTIVSDVNSPADLATVRALGGTRVMSDNCVTLLQAGV